jgi:hypothetical protein
MDLDHGRDEQELDHLFRAYAQACPVPEPSTNFMPDLWLRIESRQSFTFSFRRMANALSTAAVALSIALGVYMSIPHNNNPNNSNTSYIEALAEANPVDAPEIVGPVRLDPVDFAGK